MAVDIVSCPSENGGSFRSYVSLPEGIIIDPPVLGDIAWLNFNMSSIKKLIANWF